MANVKEFMAKTKLVDGWFIARVFVMGAFCGSILAVMFMWAAVVK
jgi:hypothetical protein